MARVPIQKVLQTSVSGVANFDTTDTARIRTDPGLSADATIYAAATGGTTLTQPLTPGSPGGDIPGFVETPFHGYLVAGGRTFTLDAVHARTDVPSLYNVKAGVDSEGNAVSDDSLTIIAALAAAVAAGRHRVLLRGETFTCHTPIVVPDNVRLEGLHPNISVLYFPTDLGWGVAAVSQDPASGGGQYAPQLDGVGVFGPGTGIGVNAGVHLSKMNGVQLYNNGRINNCVIQGFHAGIQFLGNHNEIVGTHSISNYFNVWWANGAGSFGNQSFLNCHLQGARLAALGVDGDNIMDGCIFTNCDLGFGPFGIYKTDVIERWGFDLSTTSGSVTINSAADAQFVVGDVGKTIHLDDFATTIATRVSAIQATVSVAPSFTRTGVIMQLGTPANTRGLINQSMFHNTSFEAVGNGAMRDVTTGTAANSATHSLLVNAGYTVSSGAVQRITTWNQNWALDLRIVNDFRINNLSNPFFAGTLGAYQSVGGAYDIDGFVSASMFGSGSDWSAATGSRVQNSGTMGHVWYGNGVIAAGDLLEWCGTPYDSRVQRFGTTEVYAGIALTAIGSAFNGAVTVMAEQGYPQVLSEAVSGTGILLTMNPATPYHAAAVPAAGTAPTRYPVIGVSRAAGGASGGSLLDMVMVSPHAQPGAVFVASVTTLPTAGATYLTQVLFVPGNHSTTADHYSGCVQDATGAYVWKQLDN